LNERQRNDLVLAVGILIVLAGLAALAGTLGLVPPQVPQALDLGRRVAGPLALLALGALVLLHARGSLTVPVLPTRGARLFRSRSDRWLAGVCGGIAAYLRVDPLAVRAVFVLLTLALGAWSGIIVYLVLATIVIPAEPVEAAPHG
jgi:phage shock protein C